MRLLRSHRNEASLATLALVVLALGLFEVLQPGGRDVASLTGDVVTFNTLVRIGILTIVVVGLNVLMGYAGQVSLGQAAFYGLGAYVSGIFTTRAEVFGLPGGLEGAWWWPWLLMGVGMAFTGLFAYLVGRPILRLKGHYLAMATLGLGIMVYILFRENFGFRTSTVNLTGGFDGLFDIPRLRLGSWELWPITRYYFLVWLAALASIAVALNLVHSRVGRALRAIHGSEVAAEAMAVDTAEFKVRALVFSAMLASLAGSLYAHFQAAVSPGPFSFIGSLELVVMAAVGGLRNVWGAPLGVALILAIEEFLRAKGHELFAGIGSEAEPVVFGIILVLIMIFLPEGLTDGLRRLPRLWQRRSGTPAASSEVTS